MGLVIKFKLLTICVNDVRIKNLPKKKKEKHLIMIFVHQRHNINGN